MAWPTINATEASYGPVVSTFNGSAESYGLIEDIVYVSQAVVGLTIPNGVVAFG